MACQKSVLEYSNDLIKEVTNNNILGNDNPAHIDSNINMDTKVKSKPNKKMTGSNVYKKNSEINIEDLFQ